MSASAMQTADRGTDRLRLAGIEFDTRTGELWKDGSRTVLPDQLFHVLAMLVRETSCAAFSGPTTRSSISNTASTPPSNGCARRSAIRRRRRGSSKRFRGAATASLPRSSPALLPPPPTLPKCSTVTCHANRIRKR